ncbi:Eco57I restriction-modification methylase domain-containing protein [Helicobacter marmotae]|uniref:site-specific DNA-methyltransferase (adenine-specific) n=1 Tax=Helicobacter marmotae TaxID=152490 RepID=A0A3D8I5C7_9HELI|nr:Eco57I restriction-modification methylase domain-containing protein [Helicobacter marmotae]RDU59761.1 hypothetical protein CQA63_05810 [Helicobacter marmotae]
MTAKDTATYREPSSEVYLVRRTRKFCHSEPPIKGEESLLKTPKGTTSDSDRDSSVVSLPQNDKLGYPQGKPTHNKHLQWKLFCHSEPPLGGEESPLSTKDSSTESLERQLLCHSEGGRSPTEESLKESLVAKRDSSVVSTPARHDKLTTFTRSPSSNSSTLTRDDKRNSVSSSSKSNSSLRGLRSRHDKITSHSKKDSSACAKPKTDNVSDTSQIDNEINNEEGWDIVLGNPPYLSSENMPKVIKDNRHLFETAYKKTDIYVFFYEFAFKILKPKGVVSYITSNKFLSQEYGLKLRELFLKNKLCKLINFNTNVFKSANVDTCISVASKHYTPNNVIKTANIEHKQDYNGFESLPLKGIHQESFKSLALCNFRLTLTQEKYQLLESIKAQSHTLEQIAFVSYGVRPCGNAKYPHLKKEDFIHKLPIGNAKPYIEAKSSFILPYRIHTHYYLDYQKDKIYNAMFESLFTPAKLMCGRTLSNTDLINFVYDDKGRFCNDSMCCIVLWKDLVNATHTSPKKLINEDKIALSKRYDLKFLQGVLNAKLISFYVKELLHDGLHFYPEHQKQLPIPKITASNQHIIDTIIALVEEILALKDSSADISHLESQIDALVYALYGLSEEEIHIIQGDKG